MNKLYTIGHSTLNLDAFVSYLKKYNINCVCDVRSTPYSKYVSQFNKENISTYLANHGIKYVYYGKYFGARRPEEEVYVDNKVDFDLTRETIEFKKGVEFLVKQGLYKYTIALMCSEKDPITCHRAILIQPALYPYEIDMHHILNDGSLEERYQLEGRMLRETNYNYDLEMAYKYFANKVAYKKK